MYQCILGTVTNTCQAGTTINYMHATGSRLGNKQGYKAGKQTRPPSRRQSMAASRTSCQPAAAHNGNPGLIFIHLVVQQTFSLSILSFSRDWWLSPVTLLLEGKNCGMAEGCYGLNQADGCISVAALRPPCQGKAHRGPAPMTRRLAQLNAATRVRVPGNTARPSSQYYCNCQFCHEIYIFKNR